MKSLKLASFFIVNFSVIISFLLFGTPAYSSSPKHSPAEETHIAPELTKLSLSSVHGPYLLVGDNRKCYVSGKPLDETIVTLSLDNTSDVQKNLFTIEPTDFVRESYIIHFGTVFLLGICPVTTLMSSRCDLGAGCVKLEKQTYTTENLIKSLLKLRREGTTFTVYAKICRVSGLTLVGESGRDKFNEAFMAAGFKRFGHPNPALPALIQKIILESRDDREFWETPYTVEVFQLD